MNAIPTINKFVWSRSDVYQHLSLPTRPVTGWTDAPVYPINEQPESDAPYVVYSWTSKPTERYMIYCDDLTFYLWDINIERLMKLEAALRNYLGREDETATAIAGWRALSGEGDGRIKILSVKYGGSSQPFTQTQESGVIGKGVTFRIEYVDCTVDAPLDLT